MNLLCRFGLVFFLFGWSTTEIPVSQLVTPEDWSEDSMREFIQIKAKSMNLRAVDYLHIINNQKVEVDFLSPRENKPKDKKRIISRRNPSAKGANFLLPLLHQNHEALVDGWVGNGNFQDYLFENNYLITEDGDSLIKFQQPQKSKFFFAKD